MNAIHDLLTSLDTIREVLKQAKVCLDNGEIQKARPLIARLASEIQFRTYHIPLATYPTAIKAIVPLIDAGKVEEAKAGLQAALNTLVVTTDDVIPLSGTDVDASLDQTVGGEWFGPLKMPE